MGQEVTGEATEVTLMRNAFGQRPGVGQVGREGPMIRRAQRSEFLSQYLSIYLLPSAFPIQSHQIVTYTHTHTPIQTSYDTGDICLIMSDSLRPHGLYSARLLCPWNSPVGSHSLLQRIFLTQGSNQGLLHWQADSLQLLQPCFPGNKLTQKNNTDSGVQFITPAGPRQSLLLAKDPDQHL